MASIGEAYIDVHANTGPFNREIDRDLNKVADDAEGELNKTGRSIGDKVSDGMAQQLRRRGKNYAKAIEDGTRNTVVQVRSIFRFDRIRDVIRRRFRRDVGETISQEIGDALENSVKGGVLSKLGLGVADAIGAGFNVSGRSPLIALLLPALLALFGVILAAVQAVGALIAVLYAVPTILASIGLQVGVVAIAFQGLGEAVQGAFAAKNAKELREALKGLTPAARDFVKTLLPLRDLFKQIRDVAQERFFAELGNIVRNIQKSLGPTLIKGFGDLAERMGLLFRHIGQFVASPRFRTFLQNLFVLTEKWVRLLDITLFGNQGFFFSLIEFSNKLMPFVERVGVVILSIFERLAGLMQRFVTNDETVPWLDRMESTLRKTVDLAFTLGEFLFAFLRQLDRAGGETIIDALSEALGLLSFYISSPAGLKAMEGLVNLAIFGIQVFTGLVLALLAIISTGEVVGEFFKNDFIPGLITSLKFFGQIIVDAATFVGVWLQRIVGWIGDFFAWLWRILVRTKDNVASMGTAIVSKVNEVVNRIKALPGLILAAVANFGTLLINAGRNLINGLIQGIRDRFPSLGSVLSQAAGFIAGFLPGSPAKEGPLSGSGYVKLRGQRMIEDFIEGIKTEAPELRSATMSAVSNIIFGPNAVQVNVAGEAPDINRARTAGSAMGSAAAGLIASRNTRLAVRTL